jgi:hypothetical protein
LKGLTLRYRVEDTEKIFEVSKNGTLNNTKESDNVTYITYKTAD